MVWSSTAEVAERAVEDRLTVALMDADKSGNRWADTGMLDMDCCQAVVGRTAAEVEVANQCCSSMAVVCRKPLVRTRSVAVEGTAFGANTIDQGEAHAVEGSTDHMRNAEAESAWGCVAMAVAVARSRRELGASTEMVGGVNAHSPVRPLVL